ncbi:MAG TPA: hypothetical protein VF228_04935 [Iamia sp.]
MVLGACLAGAVVGAGAVNGITEEDEYAARPAEEFEFSQPVDTVFDLRDPEQAAELDRLQAEAIASGERPDASVGIIPAEPPMSGPEREAADEARAAAEDDHGPTDEVPTCPAAAEGTVAVAFRCGEGYGHFGTEGIAATGDPAADLLAALAALSAGPTEAGRAAGLASSLEGVPVEGATVRQEGEVLVISFDAAFAEALAEYLPAQGVTIVAQLSATATALPGITGWEADVEGDCMAFAVAVEGEVCVTYTAADIPSGTTASDLDAAGVGGES